MGSSCTSGLTQCSLWFWIHKCYIHIYDWYQEHFDRNALRCVPLNLINLWSLAPRRSEWNFRQIIFELTLIIASWGISSGITPRWMSLKLTDGKSTFVQVMAWCCLARSHYLSQCWSRSMLPYGINRPKSVKDKSTWFLKNTVLALWACDISLSTPVMANWDDTFIQYQSSMS